MGLVGFGFAAGCAAVAEPRRGGSLIYSGAMPLVWPLAQLDSKGSARTRGHRETPVQGQVLQPHPTERTLDVEFDSRFRF